MPGHCRPNFFIIGAPKCGTTSLHFYLDQHPEISMSRVKEPNVFSEPRWLPSLDGYDGQFDCHSSCRGEASTSYSRYPAEGAPAPRIHAAVPDARLIYVVGDPVERIISDYVQTIAGGVESRPIEQALREFDDPENWYVCASRYATQLNHFLEYFDASAVHVIDQSDLRDRRDKTVSEVFGFLGVDPEFRSRQFAAELFSRDDQVPYRGLGWRLRVSFLGRAFRKLPPRFRLPISRMIRRRAHAVPRPSLDPALREQLVEFLRPEVEELRSLTGKPFEHWPEYASRSAAR
jgi:hypothetical protein